MVILVFWIRVNPVVYPRHCYRCHTHCTRFNASSEILFVVAEGFSLQIKYSYLGCNTITYHLHQYKRCRCNTTTNKNCRYYTTTITYNTTLLPLQGSNRSHECLWFNNPWKQLKSTLSCFSVFRVFYPCFTVV